MWSNEGEEKSKCFYYCKLINRFMYDKITAKHYAQIKLSLNLQNLFGGAYALHLSYMQTWSTKKTDLEENSFDFYTRKEVLAAKTLSQIKHTTKCVLSKQRSLACWHVSVINQNMQIGIIKSVLKRTHTLSLKRRVCHEMLQRNYKHKQ